MGDSHAMQQLPALLAAGRGIDLGAGRAGDGDRGLPHAAGGGVDQHLVAGLDVREVVQAVPRRGRRGGDCSGLVVAQACRQGGGHIGVTRHERAPAAVGRDAADVVADPVRGDLGSHRGHHTGEVDSQLRLTTLETRVAAEGHQDVGEVEAGRRDGDLDLSRPRQNAVERRQFQGLDVTRGADLQAHAVAGVVDDGGVALVGPQWARVEAGGVALPFAEGGLVLLVPAQQLAGHQLGVDGVVDVDLGGPQLRVLGTDHAQQATQAGVLEIRPVSGQHRLGVAGDDVQPRRVPRDVGELTGDAHQVAHLLAAAQRQLSLVAAVEAGGDDHDIVEAALGEVRAEALRVVRVVGMPRP